MKMKISIRWALIAGFLGLIWGTHIVTTTSSYLTSQEVLRRHATDIMKNIAELAMEQSQRHLLHAHGAAALTRRLLASKVVSSKSDQTNALERYLHEQLLINPHFAGIYLGMPNGDFYDVRRFDAKIKDGFRTKVILHSESGRNVNLIYRDSNFTFLSGESDDQDTYDPRVRPWYRKAIDKKQIVWTEPYIFFTSQKPGITIAGPFFDSNGKLQGVVGVDIEIDQLSVFIGNLKIGKNGKAFMLNHNADVVAFGEMEKLKISDAKQNNALRLVKIQELDDAYSRKAFEAAAIETDEEGMLLLAKPRFSRFTHQGHVYHAMFTPFSTHQWPWIIGVYLPEDDYLGAIKANRFHNIIVTFAISLFAAVMGFFLARGMVRPIEIMGKTAKSMKKGKAPPLPLVHSRYKEIQETANAFSEMKIAVEKSNRKYQGIFHNIQDVYFETSPKGILIEISPSVERYSRYRREELIGKEVGGFYVDPEERDRFFRELLEKGRIHDTELSVKEKDGTPIYCSLTASVLRTPSGKPYRIIGSLRNIHDRKIAEQKLLEYKNHLESLVDERTRELKSANVDLIKQMERRRVTEKRLRISEEKYRTILDTIEEAYFEMNLSGMITFVNDAACRIMGYTADELSGMHFRHFSAHQPTRTIIKTFRKVVKTGKPSGVITYPVLTKDKNTKMMELRVALTTDTQGTTTGFRGLARDVTVKIMARKEKEKLQAQLHHSQRMEAVGTLAGGIAHDFNNLLMGIAGNVSLIESGIEPNHQLSESIQAIEQCVESGASLTRQLLGYARGGKYQVTAIDLNETVRRTAEMFGRTQRQIRIETRFESKIWTVRADQGQIDQVLMNLYVNAWQAMTDDKTLSLTTENVVLDKDYVTPFGVKPGKYVCIRIQDRGCGIEPSNIKRIFEPFFTTKKIGRGTGLGLASAFGIVKNHGGIIDVESLVGKGTTFTINLPAVEDVLENLQHPQFVKTGKTTGRLLIVDDEPYILKALSNGLKRFGYEVVAADNGKDAISLFEKQKDLFDAVILDIIMPDMGGDQVLTALKRISPTIKIILSSGYSLDGLNKNKKESRGDGFIQKPYQIDRLATLLSKLINTGEKDE